MSPPKQIFDPSAIMAHRRRAKQMFSSHNFLHQEIKSRLEDRLKDVRKDFDAPIAIDAYDDFFGLTDKLDLVGNCADLITCTGNIHWANDLPGILIQIRQALKPNGLFLAAFPGGETLGELRQSFIEAESKLTGGASPRISPFVDLADAAALLQRTGFKLPVADQDRIIVTYRSVDSLMFDLRGMGETNSLRDRKKKFSRKDVFSEMKRLYRKNFSDHQQRLRATFDIVFLTGWSPHSSQPQPLRPGSGLKNLAEVLKKSN